MLIKDHSQLSDEVFERQFAAFELKPRLFSHEAHLRLAYIHIKKYGREQAERNMCDQIEGYALSLGITDKFNKTVTIAAVKVVDHFMRKSGSANFKDFIKEFPRLKTNFKDLLAQHYGFNVFRDLQAKQSFVEPDLAPFE